MSTLSHDRPVRVWRDRVQVGCNTWRVYWRFRVNLRSGTALVGAECSQQDALDAACTALRADQRGVRS